MTRKQTKAILAAAFSAACLLAGCSNGAEPFEKKSYSADGAAVSSIQVEVRDRDIAVALSEDDRIHIAYAENSKETYEMAVTGDGVLKMTAKTDKGWADYIGGKASKDDRAISLRVPDGLLASLELSTTNGDVALSAMTLSDTLSVRVNNGSTAFGLLEVGREIRLEAKNGDISGSIRGGYDDFAIGCRVKKGDSNLPERKEGGEKALHVAANHGDVQIEFVP